MQIHFDSQNNTLIVQLDGDLDHHSATLIREEIDQSIIYYNASKLIFDLKNLSFIDSSGIGIIMGRYKLMQERSGQVSLAGINMRTNKLINVSGLRKIIPVFSNVQDALGGLQ